ncbi:MAG: exodeoxyribonuclease VII small subunit [Clostridia bacterium]|nr:exodeoxyribonuclease VII small subunit [Clostridia bacterium]
MMENRSYEDLMAELELVSKRLSSESLLMEEMVELYERGMELNSILSKMLDSFDARIEKVTLEYTKNEG